MSVVDSVLQIFAFKNGKDRKESTNTIHQQFACGVYSPLSSCLSKTIFSRCEIKLLIITEY